MHVLLRQAVDLILSCRDKFVEFSYLRSADKKHGVPEHLEKTVLFLVDASPVAKADADAQDWDAQASSAKAAEEEAAAAVKAAWHAAKEAKEVLDSSCHLCCACAYPLHVSLTFDPKELQSFHMLTAMCASSRAAVQQACFSHSNAAGHAAACWQQSCLLDSCATAWFDIGPRQQQCNNTCLISAGLLLCNPLHRRSNVYRLKCVQAYKHTTHSFFTC